MRLKLSEIASSCGGKLFGDGDIAVTGFFTDSRKAEADKMFLPIKGENTDAHKFIPSVFDAGCKASFSENILVEPKGSYVLVNNSIKALQDVAADYRSKFKIPFIGITGSVGKTTTKEMVALALSSGLKVHKTAGNANSQIGLPLTVLGTEPEDEAAVIEMGMSMPGEMERIAAVAKPDIAVMTNIGVSHIEFHGSREKIMEQKLHITDHFTEDNTLFVNGDDDLLRTLKGKLPFNVVSFGIDEGNDYRAVNIEPSDEGYSFICLHNGTETAMSLSVPGIHNIRNALVAFALSEHLGIAVNKAVRAIASYTPPEMRQQIKKFGSITVIDDSYNASPDSMFGALQILGDSKGRKIAVLADMLELGAYSPKGHRDVGEKAKEISADLLICIGEESKYIAEGFGSSNCAHFMNCEEAWEFLGDKLLPGDTVLVKGSRGMRTDKIVSFIEKKYS